MNAIDHFIALYGVWAVFLGAGLEGEAVVTAGGIFAHRGAINPYFAALAAAAGSFTADQIIFFLARTNRENRFIQRLLAKPAADRAVALLHKYPNAFCIAFRYIYGLRIAGPAAIGVSQIPAKRFVVLNFISASLWGSIFTYIGYRFGHAFEVAIGAIVSDKRLIAGVVALVLIIIAIVLIRRHRAKPA